MRMVSMHMRGMLYAVMLMIIYAKYCYPTESLSLVKSTLCNNQLIREHEYISAHFSDDAKSTAEHFTNHWVVKIEGNPEDVIKTISNNGFIYSHEIEIFDNYHLFKKVNHPEKHNVHSNHHTEQLLQHENITFAHQLFGRRLNRRDNFDLYKRSFPSSRYERAFNDELWSLQWYEQDYRSNENVPTVDMNLVPVYQEFNITGNGVRVVLIDDGIEYTHDDIKDNFDPEISYNFNRNIFDVMPRYEDPLNCHGTRCAGEIAMKANNTKCGVGIAYNCKVGGITLLDGIINDLLESLAVTYALDKVDVYSGSWGPDDNGCQVEGPGPLGNLAFFRGISLGRKGRGALYVFASGNGGGNDDNCSADGYINSIYTIAVASATRTGNIPFYSERCPAIITTAYSGTMDDNIRVVTTDIHNSCTVGHTGTSAAAPLVAGILALALEANPKLTWRDAQHIIICSSDAAPLNQSVEWIQNSFGFRSSTTYGFGLINAYKLVSAALNWITVPQKYICSVPFDISENNKAYSSASHFISNALTDGCNGKIRYLEHVQLNATLSYEIRGFIEIELTSPTGTTSKIIEKRRRDFSNKGFLAWKFMSLQFWGENPEGLWTVRIYDAIKTKMLVGEVTHLELILHGTEEQPQHYKQRFN